MTQKQLRAIARATLAKVIQGHASTPEAVNAAIQVLHAPSVKGE